MGAIHEHTGIGQILGAIEPFAVNVGVKVAQTADLVFKRG
jgi:hypothetical protein